MTAPLVPSLPLEIVEKIVIIATDGEIAIILQLCMVSQSFHQSFARRLYHTLHNISPSKLEVILHQSVKMRPQIASWVRVFTLQTTKDDDLINEALTVFTNLQAFGPKFSVSLDPTLELPTLCRFIQAEKTNIPIAIARNLTHLYCTGYGHVYDFLSQLATSKESFGCLTHLLVAEWSAQSPDPVLPPISKLLHQTFPRSFPDTLKCLVLMLPLVNYRYLGSRLRAQKNILALLDIDDRIVFWPGSSDNVPLDWNGPFLLDYQSKYHASEEVFEMLPDGFVGLWKHVELWIERVKTYRADRITSSRIDELR
ncbi:hypothetical protein DL96DRAFT_1629471 [Flagelloscypha sp. PMI_526]|nr:hypothetical protein DL96DRAFT_1629471 [Flagelloscypha sp. PMI_526]